MMNTYIFGFKTKNSHGHAVITAESFDDAQRNVRKKLKPYNSSKLQIELEQIIPVSDVFVVSTDGNKLIKE